MQDPSVQVMMLASTHRDILLMCAVNLCSIFLSTKEMNHGACLMSSHVIISQLSTDLAVGTIFSYVPSRHLYSITLDPQLQQEMYKLDGCFCFCLSL